MKLMDTSIPATYSESVKALAFHVAPTYVGDLLDIGMKSIANFMQIVKDKSKTTLKVADQNGTFLFAAVVNYHPNDDEEMPGNYTFEFSFNENDIEDGGKVYTIEDDVFKKVAKTVAFEHMSMRFKSDEYLVTVFYYLFKTLVDWLKTNDGEIEHNTFVATSGVEDDEKVMSIVPDGILKRMIKDDASLEEDVAS